MDTRDEIRIYHDSLPSLNEEDLACYIDYLNIIDVEWEKYDERADIIREYLLMSKLLDSKTPELQNQELETVEFLDLSL